MMARECYVSVLSLLCLEYIKIRCVALALWPCARPRPRPKSQGQGQGQGQRSQGQGQGQGQRSQGQGQGQKSQGQGQGQGHSVLALRPSRPRPQFFGLKAIKAKAILFWP